MQHTGRPAVPRSFGLGLHRLELALDGAALVAVVVELVREADAAAAGALPVVLLVVAAAAARRRLPTVAAVAAVVASGLTLLVPDAAVAVWVVAQVCLFSLALRGPRSSTLRLGGTHAALLYVGTVLTLGAAPLDPLALLMPVWTAAVVAAGLFLRTNADYVSALEEQHRSQEERRRSEVRHRVDEERLRIARDLHDSVAHTVSAVAIHAGAAERHLTTSPERARAALQQVRASARAVVEELQAVLVVLRSPDDLPVPAGPVPGLDSLADLVEAARATGMDVHLTADHGVGETDVGTEGAGTEGGIDVAVGLAAFRIVQESLTNARKHGAGPVTVTTSRTTRELRIEVTNPVGAQRASASPAGFGVVGMRERAASVRGTLETIEASGVFTVRAVLPARTHDASKTQEEA
ncbi:sensor histidine kinase [Kineococcus sp. DHX-1]|uniref:sensor histidine kinase n=1 Tax=Kineococcus sp. DHX-1 TaxID=3349638 RepID=UPI0036D2E9B6